MKVYMNDDKTHVDPWSHKDILWGLKAHCVSAQSETSPTLLEAFCLCNCKTGLSRRHSALGVQEN